MKSKITKKDCNGCQNNFYNGNNNLGVQECWMFKDATMETALRQLYLGPSVTRQADMCELGQRT